MYSIHYSFNYLNVHVLIFTKIAFPICQRTSFSFAELLQMLWLRTNSPTLSVGTSLLSLSTVTACLHRSIPLLNKKSGGYRSRTDDPLRARQVL